MAKTARRILRRTMTQYVAERATGCDGAGDYEIWAEQRGYPYCEVIDWTSSAGDWTFIVSKDGKTWYLLHQSNDHPRRGFTRKIDLDQPFEGTADEVKQLISEMME